MAASFRSGHDQNDKRLSWEKRSKNEHKKKKKETFNIQMNSVKLFDNINL